MEEDLNRDASFDIMSDSQYQPQLDRLGVINLSKIPQLWVQTSYKAISLGPTQHKLHTSIIIADCSF
jgi:hypothetical protein